MLYDLQNVQNDPFEGDYDACVCGTGPAGLTVARKLAASGARVLLLEAGGLDPSARSADIYRAKSVGRTYYGAEFARLRYFGGTSGHWTGLCGMFDELDFSQRDIWGLPGWPITREQAYQHFAEACEILDIPNVTFDQTNAPSQLQSDYHQYASHLSPPTRFGEKFREDIRKHPRIDAYLNANVIGLKLHENGSAAQTIKVSDYSGKHYQISAKQFVIAFGALENARFLLNADRQNNGALSSKAGMLGKCFMEHFGINLGRFIALDPSFWTQHNELDLKPAPDRLAADQLCNGILSLRSTSDLQFYGRLAPLKKIQRNISCSTPSITNFARQFGQFACAGDGQITTMLEQTPNPSSKISLDDASKDQFDQPHLILDWQISDVDKTSIRELALGLGKSLARKNLGRMKLYEGVMDASIELGLHSHHMGTTRMSVNPAHGVVDRNSRFHGIENLYVAGGSVFPTGGANNPTFTIVNLALRLGEHLSSELAR